MHTKNLIEREALFAACRTALNNRKALYLSGPAGFGKTQSAQLFAQTFYQKPAYLSCNHLRHKGQTLEEALKELGTRDLIIIDNVHILEDEHDQRVLLNLVHDTHRPALIIIGRDPNLHLLNPYFLTQDIFRIKPESLLFSKDEVGAYFDVYGIAHDEKFLDHFHKATKGWPIAIASLVERLVDGEIMRTSMSEDLPTRLHDYLFAKMLAPLSTVEMASILPLHPTINAYPRKKSMSLPNYSALYQ